MKKFTFKLERILRLRSQDEAERRRALGDVERRMAAVRIDLEGIEAQRAAERDALRQAESAGRLDVRRVLDSRAFQAGLQLRTARCIESLRSLAVERQNRLDDYIEARKRRRVLEKLRSRQFERWRLEANRREHAEADDFASMAHRRRTIGA